MHRNVLIAPLGNPGTHAYTLHSAGIHLGRGLRKLLDTPTFTIDRNFNGFISADPNSPFTFLQSQCFRQYCPKHITADFQMYRRYLPTIRERRKAQLVLLHEELEAPLGTITVRPSWASTGGHPLLENCEEEFLRAGIKHWTKIGVGIGNPVPGIGIELWFSTGEPPRGLSFFQWIKCKVKLWWPKDGELGGFRGWLPITMIRREDLTVIENAADQVLSLLLQDTWIFDHLEAQRKVEQYQGPVPPATEHT